MKSPLLPALLILLLPAAAGAALMCAEEDTQVWRILCKPGIFFPLEGCTVKDICLLPDIGAEDGGDGNVTVETPDDTPPGFQEHIFIME